MEQEPTYRVLQLTLAYDEALLGRTEWERLMEQLTEIGRAAETPRAALLSWSAPRLPKDIESDMNRLR